MFVRLLTLSTITRFAITKKPGGFSRLLNAGRDGIAGYFFRRSAIANLGELDDRALRDIGLERSRIKAAVYGFVTLRNRGRM
ncbi:DUF1127 domain-containing protein [Bradyrhizobium sp. Tv2a-2]|uniref:DUF1127 domain-containing protein n=1 Tax=Bradyrhizobium sp. Tv2a-2 TaxID=113395 RepID=UPI000406DAA8|nr:DUF1127 domain-containing protein [Bradyrhizobium sp. Tv2a-2]